FLVADPEPHRAGGQHADLLVVVRVLGNHRPRLELDDDERRPLAGDAAADHALPDPVRCGPAEVAEPAHSRPDLTTPIKSHTPRIPESRNPMNEITCSPITCGPFLAKIPIRLDPIRPPATTTATTSRLKTTSSLWASSSRPLCRKTSSSCPWRACSSTSCHWYGVSRITCASARVSLVARRSIRCGVYRCII